MRRVYNFFIIIIILVSFLFLYKIFTVQKYYFDKSNLFSYINYGFVYLDIQNRFPYMPVQKLSLDYYEALPAGDYLKHQLYILSAPDKEYAHNIFYGNGVDTSKIYFGKLDEIIKDDVKKFYNHKFIDECLGVDLHYFQSEKEIWAYNPKTLKVYFYFIR